MRITGNNEVVVMLVLAGLLAVAGVWFLLLARRRREGARLYCSTCDYPLQGLPDGTTHCPECGADITKRGSVALGLRARDKALTGAGIVLLLPALVAVSLYGIRLLRTPAPPVRLISSAILLYSSRLPAPPPTPPNPLLQPSGTTLADSILAPIAPPNLDALLKEAARRADLSSRSGSLRDDEWIARLVKAGLQRHADRQRDWPMEWARFIESLRASRHLGRSRWHEYLRNAVQVDLKLRESIEPPIPFPIEYSTRVRMSPELALRLQCRALTFTLDNATTDDVLSLRPTPANRFKSNGAIVVSLKDQWVFVRPNLKHTARLSVLLSMSQNGYDDSASDLIIRAECNVEVLSKGGSNDTIRIDVDAPPGPAAEPEIQLLHPDSKRHPLKFVPMKNSASTAPIAR